MQAQEEVIMIKGKRNKRPRLALTMATSSSSTAELSGGGFIGGVISDVVSRNSDRLTPSPSNSGDLTQSTVEEEEDMANCLILLAKGSLRTAAPPLAAATAVEVYQCKTCNKSFPSFQALGGHRASHTKPNNKPILTVEDKKPLMTEHKQEDFQSNGHDNSTILSLQISNKSRVHECSICRAEFASGQALGGHMRRHRPIPAVPPPSNRHGESQEVKRPRNILSLDLNLPAPEDDHAESNKFPFAAKEQVIVFSTSSLVDCHY